MKITDVLKSLRTHNLNPVGESTENLGAGSKVSSGDVTFAELPTLTELQATSSQVKEGTQLTLLFSGVIGSGLNLEY